MKDVIKLFLSLTVIIITGCASMDLRVDTLPMSSLYGKTPPRVKVVANKCRYYTKEQAPDPSEYTTLAQYIIQENPQVLTSHSPQEMICYAYKKAIKEGADAIIVDDMSTTNVAGGALRTSPIVKVRLIRFNGDLPTNLK